MVALPAPLFLLPMMTCPMLQKMILNRARMTLIPGRMILLFWPTFLMLVKMILLLAFPSLFLARKRNGPV